MTSFFLNVDAFSFSLCIGYHEYLKSISQSERDLLFIRQINRVYDVLQRSINEKLNKYKVYSHDDVVKKLMYIGWLCMTSYPDFRAILIRQMTRTLCRNISLSPRFLELFIDVNDAYVSSSALCGVYGALLINRDKNILRTTSRIIYDKLYSSEDVYPSNLLIRQWSYQILEYAYHQDSSIDYFNKIEWPLKDTTNPLTWDINEVNVNIFGKTKGGERLKYNVFSLSPVPSDFNRYIIGTNSAIENRHFLTYDVKKIPLKDIEKMISMEIIKLGWNDELGNIDKGQTSEGRTDNRVERIGKKYLWIAYQNVIALLSDHCLFSMDSLIWAADQKLIENPAPWMLEGNSKFDPTLNVVISNFVIPNILFKSTIDNFDELLYKPDSFPSPILIGEDNSVKWVQVDAWDNWRRHDRDDYKCNFHLQYVSWFVKGINEQEIEDLIIANPDMELKMPYDSQYEYLWNEYPWSSRSRLNEYAWSEFGNEDGLIMPVRVSQLQEEMMGIEYEDQPISSSMAPNWHFMDKMHLHTAERGIIRNTDDEVVAYNRNIQEHGCSSLIMRKDVLDAFLEHNGYAMIMQIEYYKSTPTESFRTYEWFIYNPQTGFKSISKIQSNYQ